MKMSTSTITTTPTSTAAKSSEDQANRYLLLKQRKEALDKKLNEKYELLHQICQKEATLFGNNLDLISSTSTATTSQLQPIHRKKIGGSFKLPDHSHPDHPSHDELNRLLLQRQMQQQISQASFRIANDPLQSKSIRRTHKLTYETSQQKISQINESINVIQRQHSRPLSQDDIDLHRSDNRYLKNTLAIVGNNMKNLQLLNVNNVAMSERRNSMKSTTSSNSYIVQASPSSASSLTSLKTLPNNGSMASPRLRNDTGTRFDYDFHQKNESPTPSNFSLQSPPIVSHQLPLCSQSLKNIKINTDNHLVSSQEYYAFANQQQNNFSNQFAHQPHISPVSRQQAHSNSENKFIHRLHSFHQQYELDMQQKRLMVAKEALQEDIRIRQAVQKSHTMNTHSPNHYTPAHSAGLGGYWTINENNQRTWIPDTKYNSPLSPPNMSKKSNSLGNFEFMHKHDNEQHDSVSISSGNSNDHKKKEKVWCETSMDDDQIAEPKQYRPRVESPTSIDIINNNYEKAHSPPMRNSRQPMVPQHFHQQSSYPSTNGHPKAHHESIYLNPLANANAQHQTPPNIPPKSTLRYSESTRSTVSNRDIENNIITHMQHAPPIQVESPQNVTIIQEGSWKPYKEEIKSYEISDFYKYSQKYRQQQAQQQQNNVDC